MSLVRNPQKDIRGSLDGLAEFGRKNLRHESLYDTFTSVQDCKL